MKTELGITGLIVMYVGNLERYQGIDLLLQSFALLSERNGVDLVIVGGDPQGIKKYRTKCRRLNVEERVHFLGPKPVELLPSLLSEADILVSARTKGNNTPMKIYPYLQSGKPVLATKLPTHTQILNSQVAMLAEPSAKPFSQAMLRLIEDEAIRKMLGTAGKKLAVEQFSYQAFREKLYGFFEWLENEIPVESKNGKADPPAELPGVAAVLPSRQTTSTSSRS
jgi:glycosyltransferase involved in cell wall biosynthesis